MLRTFISRFSTPTPTAGLQLQRCKQHLDRDYEMLPGEEHDDAVYLVTTPAMTTRDGKWLAVVGEKLHLHAQAASA